MLRNIRSLPKIKRRQSGCIRLAAGVLFCLTGIILLFILRESPDTAENPVPPIGFLALFTLLAELTGEFVYGMFLVCRFLCGCLLAAGVYQIAAGIVILRLSGTADTASALTDDARRKLLSLRENGALTPEEYDTLIQRSTVPAQKD